MEIELIFFYRGWKSILGFIDVFFGGALILEIILLNAKSFVYYNHGPFVKKKKINDPIKIDVLKQTLKKLSQQKLLIVKDLGDTILIHIRPTKSYCWKYSSMNTQRLLIKFHNGKMICESRKMLSSIMLPLFLSVTLITLFFTSDANIFEKILASAIFGTLLPFGVYFTLNGEKTIIDFFIQTVTNERSIRVICCPSPSQAHSIPFTLYKNLHSKTFKRLLTLIPLWSPMMLVMF